MLLIVIVAFVLGSLLFRGRTLPESTMEAIEPMNKAVQATVDGRPVHCYVMPDNDKS
jgi:hypothetical protein